MLYIHTHTHTHTYTHTHSLHVHTHKQCYLELVVLVGMTVSLLCPDAKPPMEVTHGMLIYMRWWQIDRLMPLCLGLCN